MKNQYGFLLGMLCITANVMGSGAEPRTKKLSQPKPIEKLPLKPNTHIVRAYDHDAPSLGLRQSPPIDEPSLPFFAAFRRLANNNILLKQGSQSNEYISAAELFNRLARLESVDQELAVGQEHVRRTLGTLKEANDLYENQLKEYDALKESDAESKEQLANAQVSLKEKRRELKGKKVHLKQEHAKYRMAIKELEDFIDVHDEYQKLSDEEKTRLKEEFHKERERHEQELKEEKTSHERMLKELEKQYKIAVQNFEELIDKNEEAIVDQEKRKENYEFEKAKYKIAMEEIHSLQDKYDVKKKQYGIAIKEYEELIDTHEKSELRIDFLKTHLAVAKKMIEKLEKEVIETFEDLEKTVATMLATRAELDETLDDLDELQVRHQEALDEIGVYRDLATEYKFTLRLAEAKTPKEIMTVVFDTVLTETIDFEKLFFTNQVREDVEQEELGSVIARLIDPLLKKCGELKDQIGIGDKQGCDQVQNLKGLIQLLNTSFLKLDQKLQLLEGVNVTSSKLTAIKDVLGPIVVIVNTLELIAAVTALSLPGTIVAGTVVIGGVVLSGGTVVIIGAAVSALLISTYALIHFIEQRHMNVESGQRYGIQEAAETTIQVKTAVRYVRVMSVSLMSQICNLVQNIEKNLAYTEVRKELHDNNLVNGLLVEVAQVVKERPVEVRENVVNAEADKVQSDTTKVDNVAVKVSQEDEKVDQYEDVKEHVVLS